MEMRNVLTQMKRMITMKWKYRGSMPAMPKWKLSYFSRRARPRKNEECLLTNGRKLSHVLLTPEKSKEWKSNFKAWNLGQNNDFTSMVLFVSRHSRNKDEKWFLVLLLTQRFDMVAGPTIHNSELKSKQKFPSNLSNLRLTSVRHFLEPF